MSKQLILVLNCGSSSLKGAVIDPQNGRMLASCLAERLTTPQAFITFKKDGEKLEVSLASRFDHAGAVGALMNELEKHSMHDRIAAIGHRVAHGGERYHESVLVNEAVLQGLKDCIPLAPLHNPANISGILAAQEHFPGLPNVAVLDTSFHQSIPERAYTYAVPRELRKKYAFRRYGFHGTSMRYVAPEAVRLLDGRPSERLIIAHLGNGASITAVKNGKSVDTSMGFTPLEGLVMGTRSGDVDAGIYDYLTAHTGMSVNQVSDMLNKKSGLLGISELSNDCRTLEQAAAEGHEGAALALDVMTYRLAKYIASMAVAAGGIDALVFTGGIGENSALVRGKTVAHLGFLGLHIDEQANLATRFGAEGIISPAGIEPAVLVVPTDEEAMIASDTAALAGLLAEAC
ncbi:acetate kinase [Neisseria perflava]|uniref:acetate kinase n=1 Tax=Neisseria perflava TaxID=33053 RepID=UPI0020A172D7|nr:acetate kinase [Neisseria perflava]MCP1659237.1 acetate kinase [Neisseria perflava]MCP1771721.1 acetate kinase [Neisseria perflava]